MKYYHSLYMSKELLPKEEDILKKIKENKWQPQIYLIVLAQNEKNHLEFFHSTLLIQKAIPKEQLLVVGIANGSDGALELIEKIAREVYDDTNGTDIRNYILRKQREFEEGNV